MIIAQAALLVKGGGVVISPPLHTSTIPSDAEQLSLMR
jgi:hypothetical protein